MSQSKPLSREEIVNVIPLLKYILKNESPIFSNDLIRRLQEECDKAGISHRTHSSRLRQMINYLRSNTQLAIIADKRGYRVAKSDEEIMAQVVSLRTRAKSIESAAEGMSKFII